MDAENTLVAFFPVHRISKRGLDVVAARVAEGWHGHFEMLVPTALADAGLSARRRPEKLREALLP